MPRQRQEPRPGTGIELEPGSAAPRTGTLPRELNSRVEFKQGRHSHTDSPAPCSLLPATAAGIAPTADPGAEPEQPRGARPGGHRCPFPSLAGTAAQALGHPDTPRFPPALPARESPPGAAPGPGEARAKPRLLSVLQDAQH